MLFASSLVAVFLAATAFVVPHLESRDDLDPSLFSLSEVPENNLPADSALGTTVLDGGLDEAQSNNDGGLSNLDSSSLLAFNSDDPNAPLYDDLGSTSLPPADDTTISNSLVSSCSGPASKKRDLSDEDLLPFM